jgi:hypothetical protein
MGRNEMNGCFQVSPPGPRGPGLRAERLKVVGAVKSEVWSLESGLVDERLAPGTQLVSRLTE